MSQTAPTTHLFTILDTNPARLADLGARIPSGERYEIRTTLSNSSQPWQRNA